MRYISIFSGIEAASVAWESLGWEPVAFAEIEPFPCAVLAERFPNVPNLGSVTDVDWSDYSGAVDVLVGGSPCQSFSIAGKREGLQGESRLMFEYIRAVREIRPRYFIWENVPGAFTSDKGEAFRQLLSEMDGLGYGLAWRVLDAQFFGVAQRRRRVFLVGVLGDGAGAAEILFERDCVQWDTPSSREKRKELAAAVEGRVGGSYTMLVRCGREGEGKGALVQDDVSATLSTSNMQTLFQPCYGMSYKAGAKAQAYPVSEELHPTLSASRHDASVCYSIQGDIARGAHMGQNGCGYSDDGSCYTLNTIDQHAVACASPVVIDRAAFNQGENAKYSPHIEESDVMDTLVARGPHAICMASGQTNAEIETDMAPAQAARQYKDPQIVCFNAGNANDVSHIGEAQSQVAPSLRASRSGTNGTPVVCTTQYGSEIAGTLMANGDSSPCHDKGANVVSNGYVVRRLTPRECERLQGFPDDWTLIEWKGKPLEDCPDAPRYKALGNSMAVPVMRWIGRRIEAYDVLHGGRSVVE